MSHGKHIKQSKRKPKRNLVIALVLALLLVAAIGSTIAYITHSSGHVLNSFTPSEITCQIDETVSDGVKSSVKVKNTGETTAYIRAAVVANAVDDNGNITGPADVSDCLYGSGWTKIGNYYYYSQPVAPNNNTDELLSRSITLNGIQVTILAEAIQAQPVSAAQNAWWYSPASGGSN